MNPVFSGPQQSLQEILISSIIDFLESTTVKMYTSVNNGKANTEGNKNVTGIHWRHKKDVDKIYKNFAILRPYN